MRPRGPIADACTLFVYAGLTVALTWPLSTNLSGLVPHDPGDPLLSTWALWWNAHVPPFTDAWWNGPIFFPATKTLTFSDHRVGLSVITSPLIWSGAPPVVAHNVAFLLSFFLSAASAYALCIHVTGSRVAALLGGLVFGFHPFRAEHLPHLELLSSYWLPLVLLALHQWIRTQSRLWLFVLAISLTMQALTSGYYFFFLGVLIGLWMLWFVPRGLTLRRYGALAAALAVPLLMIAPILLTYRGVHQALGLSRSIVEIEEYSADIIGLFAAPSVLAFWDTPREWYHPEGALMPGATAVVLVIGACVFRRRQPHTPMPVVSRWRRAPRALLIAAGIALAISIVPWLSGPIAFELTGVRVSVSAFYKPFSIATLLFGLWCLTSATLRRAHAQRSAFAFYALATCAMWVLAFGPTVRLLGERVIYKAPYAWLMLLPGFRDEFRVPARFAMLAALTLGVAAALAFWHLFGTRAPRVRAVAVCMVVLGIMLDSWIHPFPVAAVPRHLSVPSTLPPDAAVLELPLGILEDAAAMYHATVHRRPIVNGMSGYELPHYIIFRLAIEEGRLDAVLSIAAHGDIAIFVARDRLDVSTNLRAHTNAQAVASTDTHEVFLLPRRNTPHERLRDDRRLPIATVTSVINPAELIRTIDGDPRTAWSSPDAQRGNEEVVADLGTAADVDGIQLALGGHTVAYPRLLAVDLSLDAGTWTEVWRGTTAAASVATAIEDPRNVAVPFSFAPQRARYVRLRQLGQSDEPWAIAELRVLAPK